MAPRRPAPVDWGDMIKSVLVGTEQTAEITSGLVKNGESWCGVEQTAGWYKQTAIRRPAAAFIQRSGAWRSEMHYVTWSSTASVLSNLGRCQIGSAVNVSKFEEKSNVKKETGLTTESRVTDCHQIGVDERDVSETAH